MEVVMEMKMEMVMEENEMELEVGMELDMEIYNLCFFLLHLLMEFYCKKELPLPIHLCIFFSFIYICIDR